MAFIEYLLYTKDWTMYYWEYEYVLKEVNYFPCPYKSADQIN